MELGVVLPHHEIGNDPGAIRDFAQGAEALGATHLLIYDHVLGVDRNRPGGFDGPYDAEVAFHEPLVTLGFVAGVTTSIDLVTAILVLPQRQAVLAAKQVAEVAILSNYRLRLGVAAGWNKPEFDALGMDFHNRGARLTEQVELMRALWANEAFSYSGDHHEFEHLAMLPRPEGPIPIMFGASAPAAIERCARLGDGWVPLGGPGEKSAQRIAELQAIREAEGLAWDGFLIQAQAQYGGGTPDRWTSHAHAWADLGATHLAIATHNAGDTDVDGHLARIVEYRDAVGELVVTRPNEP